jgi:hypothetical protein
MCQQGSSGLAWQCRDPTDVRAVKQWVSTSVFLAGVVARHPLLHALTWHHDRNMLLDSICYLRMLAGGMHTASTNSCCTGADPLPSAACSLHVVAQTLTNSCAPTQHLPLIMPICQ